MADTQDEDRTPPEPTDDLVTTSHTLTTGRGKLDYTALTVLAQA